MKKVCVLLAVIVFAIVFLANASAKDYDSTDAGWELLEKNDGILHEISMGSATFEAKLEKLIKTNSYTHLGGNAPGKRNNCNGGGCWGFAETVMQGLFGKKHGHNSVSKTKGGNAGNLWKKSEFTYQAFIDNNIPQRGATLIRTQGDDLFNSSQDASGNKSDGHSMVLLYYNKDYVYYLHSYRPRGTGTDYVNTLTKQSWTDWTDFAFYKKDKKGNKVKNGRRIKYIVKISDATFQSMYPDTYEIISKNLNSYYTVKGIKPNPYTDSTGFSVEGNVGNTISVYSLPDASATPKDVSVLSYFQVKEKVKNKSGEEWYKLNNDTFIRCDKLTDTPWFTETVVQAGEYKANIKTQYGKAPFDAKHKGTDIANGSSVEVILAVKNCYNNVWYKLSEKDGGGWVYSGHFDYVQKVPKITIAGVAAPSGIYEKISSFELKGKITSEENISSVVGTIYNNPLELLRLKDAVVVSKEVNPKNAKTVDIYHTAINTGIKFGSLKDGIYRYSLKVTTSSGYTAEVYTSMFTIASGGGETSGGEQTLKLVQGITVTPQDLALSTGQTYDLTAAVLPADATYPQVKWSSSDSEIATVDANGKVTAIGKGVTTIMASAADSSGVNSLCLVTVTEPVRTITIDPSQADLECDSGISLLAVVEPENASDRNVIWSSSDETVVKVDQKGYVKTINVGNAYVYATAADGSGQYGICKISVADKNPNIASGVWDNLSWVLNKDGELHFYGSGPMKDMEIINEKIEWLVYQDQIINVFFDDGITSIGQGALAYCRNLEGVSLPDSIESINNYAFEACENLKEIHFPNNLRTIGMAFGGCTGLTSLYFPPNISWMNSDLFFGCTNLKHIVVDKSNPNYVAVDDVLFSKDMTTLFRYPIGKAGRSYTVPDTVVSIAGLAFESCKQLESISVHNGITSIEDFAFWGSGIKRFSIPEKIIHIGVCAFYGCADLEEIYIPGSVTSIASQAFEACESLKDVYYSGTEEMRGKVSFDEYNDELLQATWHYLGIAPGPEPEPEPESESEPENEVLFSLLGDSNGDDVVDGRDAITIMRLLSEDVEFIYINTANADVNQDGKVDESDLQQLMNYYAGVAPNDLINTKPTLSQRIYRIIQYPSDYQYETDLDLNNDGYIDQSDYDLAKEMEAAL